MLYPAAVLTSACARNQVPKIEYRDREVIKEVPKIEYRDRPVAQTEYRERPAPAVTVATPAQYQSNIFLETAVSFYFAAMFSICVLSVSAGGV